VTGNFKNDELSELGIGTGVIVDSAGYVLTNWHVIAGYQAGVIFLKPTLGTDISQTQAYGARVIAQSPVADLALLKIVKPPAGLHAVPIADISSAQIAEDIHIIGHPRGNLWSYSTGVISQVREAYTWSYSDGSKHQAKVLQMQTAVNPGNSGGPVLDDSGRILGLVAMSEEGQNLNYAVAADVIKGFIASTLQSRTRGASPETSSPKPQYSTLRMQDGRMVTRAIYSAATIYSITDAKGQSLGLVAETSDGTTVEAWDPNPLGGFGNWTVRLSNGKSVSAHASGPILDHFGGPPAPQR
jgi:S1-C subfamily serine protease